MKTETDEKKGRKAIKSNAIGHVADCRCVVCRNSDFTEPKSEPRQMSDEQMRARIAEHCGFKNLGVYQGFGIKPDRSIALSALPNYLHSLDAMHAAEKRLTEVQCHVYHEALCSIHAATTYEEGECPADGFWFHASARLRALAFIQTIDRTTNP